MTPELCLVLLLDGSTSLTLEQWSATVEAHARAMEDPDLAALIADKGVAVAAVAFAGAPTSLLPWRTLRSREDAVRFAADLRAHTDRVFRTNDGTATGSAVRHALRLLQSAPECERQVIDVATDGQENVGVPTTIVRDEATEAGVTINAVVLHTSASDDPAEWARGYLVTPGGFVIEATSWEAWVRAIEKKLVMETAGLMP